MEVTLYFQASISWTPFAKKIVSKFAYKSEKVFLDGDTKRLRFRIKAEKAEEILPRAFHCLIHVEDENEAEFDLKELLLDTKCAIETKKSKPKKPKTYLKPVLTLNALERKVKVNKAYEDEMKERASALALKAAELKQLKQTIKSQVE